MNGAQAETVRLFFALWPDNRVRDALDRASTKFHGACGGRRMRAPNIHLTLVFLGNVEAARLDELRALAASVAVPAFTMTLTRLGWWRHNKVAWAGTDETPPELLELVEGLQQRLRQAGIAFDAKGRFVPHVTLLRNARCEGREWPALAPVEWHSSEFVLVQSVTGESGAAYEAIGRWKLL